MNEKQIRKKIENWLSVVVLMQKAARGIPQQHFVFRLVFSCDFFHYYRRE